MGQQPALLLADLHIGLGKPRHSADSADAGLASHFRGDKPCWPLLPGATKKKRRISRVLLQLEWELRSVSRWAPTSGVLTFACLSSRASCGSSVKSRVLPCWKPDVSLSGVPAKAEIRVERCHLPLPDAYLALTGGKPRRGSLACSVRALPRHEISSGCPDPSAARKRESRRC